MQILEIFKKNYHFLFIAFLFIYIITNLLDGERGLISLFEKKNKLKDLEAKKIVITKKIQTTEKNNLLLSDSIDLDYLEILLREKLFYGKSNEKVYLIQQNEN